MQDRAKHTFSNVADNKKIRKSTPNSHIQWDLDKLEKSADRSLAFPILEKTHRDLIVYKYLI